MFNELSALPADPILGLMALYTNDQNPNKIDLGVGVYKDENGNTPVLNSIKTAEKALIESQLSKAYVGPMGDLEFNALLPKLMFGEQSAVLRDGRLSALQTPGGCGALRVAAELIRVAMPKARLWVSDPTWGNHIPLLGGAGLEIKTYPYYNPSTHGLDFEAMMMALNEIPAGDLLLLHGSCHNPTGVDLTNSQWDSVAEICTRRGLIPFVDMAYQGFGDGLDEDAYGLRKLASTVPEMLLAASCSKNFGLYRERTGLVGVMCESSVTAAAVSTHLLSICRGIYSMPPAHGASLVASVLGDSALRAEWIAELEHMRQRIQGLRKQFSATMRELTSSSHFDFVEQQKGMFSFLGLNLECVKRLQSEHSIYMLASSRASIAGMNEKSVPVICQAIVSTLQFNS